MRSGARLPLCGSGAETSAAEESPRPQFAAARTRRGPARTLAACAKGPAQEGQATSDTCPGGRRLQRRGRRGRPGLDSTSSLGAAGEIDDLGSGERHGFFWRSSRRLSRPPIPRVPTPCPLPLPVIAGSPAVPTRRLLVGAGGRIDSDLRS